jgi:hypothetical protein
MQGARDSVVQMGYVVKPGGLEAAMNFWAETARVGPFFTGRLEMVEQIFRGKPTNAEISIVIFYYGSMQIELIEQLNDSPSPYNEWLSKLSHVPVGGSFHHFMIDHSDFDATTERWIAAGCKEAFVAKSHGYRIAYLDAAATTGGFVELIDEIPAWRAMCREMLAISQSWNGERPRRRLYEDLKVSLEQ